MDKKNNVFEFSKYIYEENTNILKLFYKVDEFEFIEEINFNPNSVKIRNLTDKEKKALDLSFAYLHIVTGISYYKLFVPEIIKIETIELNKEQKEFFDSLYFNGLGEFAFKNNIDLRGKINFPYKKNKKNVAENIKLNNDFIIPIGGGKDSVLTLEIVKLFENKKLYTFSVNTAKPIQECCDITDCDNITVIRKISPVLLEINKDLEKYKAYNGHIPITSIISFISVCTGILYNCNTTIISNEKSANVGNVMHNGVMVNHQWSKSFEAEIMINNFIRKYIIKDFNYFSLLRPIHEIHIAKLFSKIKKYNKVFASCNKNFKIIKDQEPKRWCCKCDKCRFVFLILAPFIKKEELIEIFGTNLLNDENQYEGYKELAGLSGYKPFECVGEISESILAFNLLQKTDFKNDEIVKKVNDEIKKSYNKKRLKKLNEKYFSFDFDNSLLNEDFKKIFENFVNREKL